MVCKASSGVVSHHVPSLSVRMEPFSILLPRKPCVRARARESQLAPAQFEMRLPPSLKIAKRTTRVNCMRRAPDEC